MALEDPFIGSGWSFPPAFDKKAASVSMSSGIRDIEESLRIIFSTALGERIMNPLFGCALDSSVFEVMNASRIAWLENLIRTAIIYHEARIDAEVRFVEGPPDFQAAPELFQDVALTFASLPTVEEMEADAFAGRMERLAALPGELILARSVQDLPLDS